VSKIGWDSPHERGDYHPYTPADEVRLLVRSADRSYSVGKRIYTMLLLATMLAIRLGYINKKASPFQNWLKCRGGKIRTSFKFSVFRGFFIIFGDRNLNLGTVGPQKHYLYIYFFYPFFYILIKIIFLIEYQSLTIIFNFSPHFLIVFFHYDILIVGTGVQHRVQHQSPERSTLVSGQKSDSILWD